MKYYTGLGALRRRFEQGLEGKERTSSVIVLG